MKVIDIGSRTHDERGSRETVGIPEGERLYLFKYELAKVLCKAHACDRRCPRCEHAECERAKCGNDHYSADDDNKSLLIRYELGRKEFLEQKVIRTIKTAIDNGSHKHRYQNFQQDFEDYEQRSEKCRDKIALCAWEYPLEPHVLMLICVFFHFTFPDFVKFISLVR